MKGLITQCRGHLIVLSDRFYNIISRQITPTARVSCQKCSFLSYDSPTSNTNILDFIYLENTVVT